MSQSFTVYQQQNTKRPNSIGSSPLSVASSMSSSSPHSIIDSELGSPSTISSAHHTQQQAHNQHYASYDHFTDDNLEYLLQELNLYGLKELPDLTLVMNDLEIYLQT
jgi:hypothetical protein